MSTVAFSYEGSELALFAKASNWKRYYARSLRPFIGSAVLEVGAGIGTTTQVLCAGEHRRWVCLEPDAMLADQIADRIRVGQLPAFCEPRVGTLRSIPNNERFDTALYIDVLEHIEHDREQLAMAVEHLNPGGHLVVLAPAHMWLFSPFDSAIGHFRRYTRKSLFDIGPPGSRVATARYLDSVGLLASLANRLFLRKALPTAQQIRVWDGYLVPCSRILDGILGYSLGKTVVVAWQRL